MGASRGATVFDSWRIMETNLGATSVLDNLNIKLQLESDK